MMRREEDPMADIQKISEPDELEPLLEASRARPVFVFKHSLTCPISTRAHRAYLSFVEGREAGEATFALLEVQKARPLSSAVAERAGIRHESPQALLFRDGEVAWHASHFKINEDALSEALAG
jgi:bacillithiol system protein YtxJ